jgi:DNA repair protein RadC
VWERLAEIRSSKKEHLLVFYLDSQNREIEREVVSVGILNANLIHPREVFEGAVRNSAAQIILAHNHPSGVMDPSEEDLLITRQLVEAGEILGIQVVDHIIVTKEQYFSFRAGGLL